MPPRVQSNLYLLQPALRYYDTCLSSMFRALQHYDEYFTIRSPTSPRITPLPSFCCATISCSSPYVDGCRLMRSDRRPFWDIESPPQLTDFSRDTARLGASMTTDELRQSRWPADDDNKRELPFALLLLLLLLRLLLLLTER